MSEEIKITEDTEARSHGGVISCKDAQGDPNHGGSHLLIDNPSNARKAYAFRPFTLQKDNPNSSAPPRFRALRDLCWLALILIALLICSTPAMASTPPESSDTVARVKVDIPETDDEVVVKRQPNGSHVFVVSYNDGRVESYSPTEFAELLDTGARERAWWHKLFNITSVAGLLWVTIGLAGQLLFTGRMVVQWLVSEKERKSVVPPIFWWMSLTGASMLLIYFIWRRDIVGVLGQGTGWFIYIRNLYFIYGPHASAETAPDITDDPGPEAELDSSRG